MNNQKKAILCIMLSALCFAFMNTFVRLAGDLPSIQKCVFRNLVAMIFAFIIIKKDHISIRYSKNELFWLFLRSFFGTIGIIANFYAIDHMNLADASMLNKLSPFFVIIFSFFILKEKITPFQAVIVLIAFIGSLFIIKPGVIGMPLFPAVTGFIGGMCAGFAYACVRRLGKQGVKSSLIVFFFSAFSCLSVLPFCIANYQPMTIWQLLCLIGAGCAAAGGQFSITAAYSMAPGRDISIYDYTQIIFVTILGYLFFDQVPDRYSFIGYVIIIAASLTMYLYNSSRNKQSA
ncbi:MAG: DMT family transporter [Lachnospiraceae bacterium]